MSARTFALLLIGFGFGIVFASWLHFRQLRTLTQRQPSGGFAMPAKVPLYEKLRTDPLDDDDDHDIPSGLTELMNTPTVLDEHDEAWHRFVPPDPQATQAIERTE
jgi:hypothetical protein